MGSSKRPNQVDGEASPVMGESSFAGRFFFKLKKKRENIAYEICLISQPHQTYVVIRPKKKSFLKYCTTNDLQSLFPPRNITFFFFFFLQL